MDWKVNELFAGGGTHQSETELIKHEIPAILQQVGSL